MTPDEISAQFPGCPYTTELLAVFADIAAGKSKDHVLHGVTKLGQRLSGVHRHQLSDMAYAALAARTGPVEGNRLTKSVKARG